MHWHQLTGTSSYYWENLRLETLFIWWLPLLSQKCNSKVQFIVQMQASEGNIHSTLHKRSCTTSKVRNLTGRKNLASKNMHTRRLSCTHLRLHDLDLIDETAFHASRTLRRTQEISHFTRILESRSWNKNLFYKQRSYNTWFTSWKKVSCRCYSPCVGKNIRTSILCFTTCNLNVKHGSKPQIWYGTFTPRFLISNNIRSAASRLLSLNRNRPKSCSASLVFPAASAARSASRRCRSRSRRSLLASFDRAWAPTCGDQHFNSWSLW